MKYITKLILLMMILCLVCGCAQVTPGTEPPADPDVEQTPDAPQPDLPVTTAENPLLDKNAKRNTALLPRGIGKNHTWIKTAAGNTLTLYYPAEQEAFYYHDGKSLVGEDEWMRALSEEYDITLHAVRKAPASALAAQRLATLSGLQLDLLAFTPSQLPYAAGLTADATDLLQKQSDATDFLNPTLLTYGNGGSRYFSPIGVARNLWYLTAGGKNEPLELSENKLWDLSAFSNFVTSHTKSKDGEITVYGIEAQDYTDFLAALGTPLIGFEEQFTDGAAAAEQNLKQLQLIHSAEGRYYNGKSSSKNAPALVRKTLSMRYGQTPFLGSAEEYPDFNWAPLPAADRNQSKGMLSACAPILALPRDGAKNEIALHVALLWTARFADANHDLLRFTYGMSFANWEKYYKATAELIGVVTAADEKTADALRELVTATTWDEDGYEALCQAIGATVTEYNERLPQ